MLVKQHPEVKRKSGPCLRYVRLSPNRRHSSADVRFHADFVRLFPNSGRGSGRSRESGFDPGCVKTSTALFLLPMIPVCFGGRVS